MQGNKILKIIPYIKLSDQRDIVGQTKGYNTLKTPMQEKENTKQNSIPTCLTSVVY